MKSERGITISTLMVYVVVMAMVILTVTNITRYFYANVTNTEDVTKYAEEYLKFARFMSEEINTTNNTILECASVEEEDGSVVQKYVIFSKTYNQYTFKDNAIYKNNEKICENIKNCTFTSSLEEGTQLKVELTMQDEKTYTTTYNIRNY